MDKSQINNEFFVFLGVTFLITIAFGIASIDQLNDFKLQRETEAVDDVALKLQKELLIATNVEDGYSRVFQIPDRIDSINYSVAIENLTLYVKSKNAFSIVSIPKVIGNVSKGTNMINRTNGIIYIN